MMLVNFINDIYITTNVILLVDAYHKYSFLITIF